MIHFIINYFFNEALQLQWDAHGLGQHYAPSETVVGFKARVKILVSHETRRPNASIGIHVD